MICTDELSLNILRNINKRIKERNFHEQTHILYDMANSLDSDKLTYCEIGSYVGSSASLMLENKKVDKIICIDPLILDKSHYGGSRDQEQTLRTNLSPYEKSRYLILKNYSGDNDVLNYFKKNKIEIDILFIDGDHTRRGVWEDFLNYKDFIKEGGFIVFDDYLDYVYCPEVRKAVDEIVSTQETKEQFEILGLPKGPLHKREYGTFVLKRKNKV